MAKPPPGSETLYVVRDRHWAKVWGANLPRAAAETLKEQVLASGKSRTARVEPMPEDFLDRVLPASDEPQKPYLDTLVKLRLPLVDQGVLLERDRREVEADVRRRVIFEQRATRQMQGARDDGGGWWSTEED